MAGEEDEEAAARGRSARSLVREIVETGLLALLVFLCVRATFQNFKVDGSSMFPTLQNNEFLIVNKLLYVTVDVEKISNFVPFIDAGDTPERHLFHGPQRGDIIVFKHPSHPEEDLIKRVIGLPGETIEIRGGTVYVNDQPLREPYIKAEWSDNRAKQRIGQGEYYVMGDNREFSSDSRAFGLVSEEMIIGKTMVTYWPMDKFGLAPNEAGKVGAAFGLEGDGSVAPVFGWRTALFMAELMLFVTAARFSVRRGVRGARAVAAKTAGRLHR